jgi:hypothetical protein
MAKNKDDPCKCVIDTHGLRQIAFASGNLKTLLTAKLSDGTIGVPSWVWQEFQNNYEEKAAELAASISKRISFNQAVHITAANITERMGLGFSLGAYDPHVERNCAAVAINKSLIVLTSEAHLPAYRDMGCQVADLDAWIAELDAWIKRTSLSQ